MQRLLTKEPPTACQFHQEIPLIERICFRTGSMNSPSSDRRRNPDETKCFRGVKMEVGYRAYTPGSQAHVLPVQGAHEVIEVVHRLYARVKLCPGLGQHICLQQTQPNANNE